MVGERGGRSLIFAHAGSVAVAIEVTEGRAARRNPRNITVIPAASAAENAASRPRAANADPNPAITALEGKG